MKNLITKLDQTDRSRRYSDEYKITTNLFVFNKIHSSTHSGCGHCGLGKGCNRRDKRGDYSIYDYTLQSGEIIRRYRSRYPNWKLTSKNRFQWQPKGTKVVTEMLTANSAGYIYYEIKF